MKKLIYLILIGIVALSYSCSKRPLCCVLPEPVTFKAQKNGQAWVLPIMKSQRINDSVFIGSVGPKVLATTHDSLVMHFVFKALGDFKPADGDVSYTVFENGVKTNYLLDATFNNSINISEFAVQHNPATTNPDPTEMKATFNLRFTDPAHTTTVSFLDGKFTAYLGN